MRRIMSGVLARTGSVRYTSCRDEAVLRFLLATGCSFGLVSCLADIHHLAFTLIDSTLLLSSYQPV